MRATSQPSNTDILRQIAAERGKFPLVKLRKLDLNTRKITVFDETNPAAAPLVVSNLEVRNVQPIALLGRDPESNPQTEIQVTGGIDPVADQFAVDVKATPFSRQKVFGVDLTVSGIHGAGLIAVAPQLSSKIDGEGMTNGQFQTSLLATLKLQTNLPTDFDFSHGGKLDFSLTKTAFRDQPGGPVLAGVGEIHSDGIVLSPNLSSVEFKELEIDNLTATGRAETRWASCSRPGCENANHARRPQARRRRRQHCLRRRLQPIRRRRALSKSIDCWSVASTAESRIRRAIRRRIFRSMDSTLRYRIFRASLGRTINPFGSIYWHRRTKFRFRGANRMRMPIANFFRRSPGAELFPSIPT